MSGARSPRGMTTNTAAGRSAGRAATSRRSTSTPPAEAPRQMMSRLRRPSEPALSLPDTFFPPTPPGYAAGRVPPRLTLEEGLQCRQDRARRAGLAEEGATAEAGRQDLGAVAGHEQEGDPPPGQRVGDREDQLAGDVDVEDGRPERPGGGELGPGPGRGARPGDGEAGRQQRALEVHGDERLVLDHERPAAARFHVAPP